MIRVFGLAGLLMVLFGPVTVGAQEAIDDDSAQAFRVSVGSDMQDEPDVPDVLEKRANLRLKNASLPEALDRLQKSSGVSVAYSPTLVREGGKVSCFCENESVASALGMILAGTDFEFIVVSEQLVIRERITPDHDLRVDDVFATPIANVAEEAVEPESAPPAPQPVGIITGRVTDGASGTPLASVQVYVQGLDLGVLTQQNGRFLIQEVPAGTHTVTAERIGYRTSTAEVTVEDAETVVQDFTLSEEALQLDEVIVTGTPGGTQRRALGNVVGQVEASNITENANIQNMQDLLTGREPGVSFSGASGIIGGGRQVRIRGTSSISMSQQPLIYVDGVRVDNDATTGPNIRQGPMTSKLDDFNPEDIESIEIIKGPAAATLYGTEASAGVIQIITKRGEAGEPEFTMRVRQGGNYLANDEFKIGDACMQDPDQNMDATPSSYRLGDLFCHNLIADRKAAGNPVFTMGHLHAYNLGIRGGSDVFRYFVSGEWEKSTGMVDYNYDQRLNLRANVSIIPSDEWTIDVSTGYVDGTTSYMQQVSGSGLWENTRWGNPLTLGTDLGGFLRATPEAIADASATREMSRFTGSGTVTFTPFEGFTNRLTVGTDVSNDVNIRLMPRHPLGADWFFGGQSLGEKDVWRPSVTMTTLDYSASFAYDLNTDFTFTTSAGAQYYSEKREETRAEGRVFASPAITSLAGAASTLATEIHDENVSMGVYAQEEVNFRDRVFFTGAVRADDNSAFGANFDAVIYPKFSATWVISEESFWEWEDWVNSLRLRTAWGKAGRQPSTFAAVTLYAPEVGQGGSSAVRPDVLGNPDVGPEVSTELEVGFDVSALQDRVSGEFTYFTQKVEDALLEVPVASSLGFGGAQSVNLGQMDNWGWEVGLNVTPVQRQNYVLNLGWSWSHTDNEIVDLGGVPPTQTMREGYYYPSWFNYDPVSAEFAEDGTVPLESVMCSAGVNVVDGYGDRGGDEVVPCTEAPFLHFGPQSIPKDEMSFSAGMTLFNDLRLDALVEWRGNTNMSSSDVGCQFSCYPRPPAATDPQDPVVAGLAVVRQLGFDGRYAVLRFPTGFAKLRNLSARYSLPDGWVEGVGVQRASVTVAGSNLWTIWQAWDHTPFNDPRGATIADMENRQVDPTSRNQGNPAVPPLSSFSVTMNVTF